MINIVKDFMENVDFAIQVYNLAKYAQYIVIFKTTNYCWFKCPHCCENSGPHNEKTYIPEENIINFLDQARQDPLFANNVVFTGGEIFSSYKFGNQDYVPNLLNYSLKNNVGTDIKTNGAWANTSFGQNIFKDLKDIATNTMHKNKMPLLQISLSLDKYHKNCFENNMKIIQELSGFPIIIHVSCLTGQEAMLEQFEYQVFKTIKTYATFGLDGRLRKEKILKNKTIYYSSCGELFSNGRALLLPEAKDSPWPQFQFLSDNGYKLVAFDNFGRVTLGENNGKKIMTPYINQYGDTKTLKQMFKDLNRNALKESLYFACYEQFFNPITR